MAASAEASEARDAARVARAAAAELNLSRRERLEASRPVPGLAASEPMGRGYVTEEALRSGLPGISFRVPGTDTQVRLYGFTKVTTWHDLNTRKQTDAAFAASLPLRGSQADRQGGDFGITARYSRFGVDTQSLTNWGTLETRIEGDFAGGSATSSNATFRLRQAFAELTMPRFSLLISQANSLWHESVFVTLIDGTSLNQSKVRQAQFRLTARLASGLTGQVSVEAPETNVISNLGSFDPGSSLEGGSSPAFNAWPDFHTRLAYQQSGWEVGLRAMLRNLQLRPAGAGSVLDQRKSATGYGLALLVQMPMRALSEAFGRDELVLMGYTGEGIGRYMSSTTGGQDAVSNLGLSATTSTLTLDQLQTYGATIAYRRFWTDQLRTSFSFSWARQDYPGYVRAFEPGSSAALSLNRELTQGFANLIWSPFATYTDGTARSGWLDLGVEAMFTRRDLVGGAGATGGTAFGRGADTRLLAGAVARF